MANVVIRPDERWDLEHLMAGIDPGNTVVLADEATEAIRRSSKWVDSLAGAARIAVRRQLRLRCAGQRPRPARR